MSNQHNVLKEVGRIIILYNIYHNNDPLLTPLLSFCLSDWVFGSRRVPNRNKTEINCITSDVNEMSELGERPRLVEMNYISLNHTNCLSSNRMEEIVVTIDETLQQQPPDTHSGT